MYIEENLKRYLKENDSILIRGAEPFLALKTLKQYMPAGARFDTNDENIFRMLVNLNVDHDIANPNIVVYYGDGQEISSKYNVPYKVWYVQKIGTGGLRRDLHHYFDMVISFSGENIASVMRKASAEEVK